MSVVKPKPKPITYQLDYSANVVNSVVNSKPKQSNFLITFDTQLKLKPLYS